MVEAQSKNVAAELEQVLMTGNDDIAQSAFESDDILLNSCTSIDIFHNPRLLTSVYETKLRRVVGDRERRVGHHVCGIWKLRSVRRQYWGPPRSDGEARVA